MTSRFVSNLILLLMGIVLLCFSLAMRGPVVAWVGLGAGGVMALSVLGAFATRGRGVVQRSLDGLAVMLAAWTIVASRVFAPGESLRWLMFSSAAAAVILAIQGLLAHEIVLEQTVRSATERESIRPGVVDHQPPIRVAG
jgi:hypothetical protein